MFFNPVIHLTPTLTLSMADAGGIIISIIFGVVFIVFSIKDAIRLDRLSREERKAQKT